MRKKIQRLTEDELRRYERALQLWEISLHKQEAELEEREQELDAFESEGVPEYITTSAHVNPAYAEIRKDLHNRLMAGEDRYVFSLFDDVKPVNVDELERLALFEDPRKG